MMATLQRVEQETVSSQSLANTIENMSKTRSDATGSRLRLKDGERLYPKSWSGSTPLGVFAREVAAWLGYVDPKHEAGKLIQLRSLSRSTSQLHSQCLSRQPVCSWTPRRVLVGMSARPQSGGFALGTAPEFSPLPGRISPLVPFLGKNKKVAMLSLRQAWCFFRPEVTGRAESDFAAVCIEYRGSQ